ncbi:MAG: hypothetical protein K2N76_02890, partial [Muribaculaceae bacterium]|nr:hypothetical protein [Muribaculaceae bacterium]
TPTAASSPTTSAKNSAPSPNIWTLVAQVWINNIIAPIAIYGKFAVNGDWIMQRKESRGGVSLYRQKIVILRL